MINRNQIDQLVGQDVYTPDGDKIGRAGQVYLDDQTSEPEWVTVHTGLFGTNESFVPLQDAQLSDGNLVVSYGKDKVKDAPNVDPENGHLDEREEDRLYEYYGLGAAGGTRQGVGAGDADEVYDQERDAEDRDVEDRDVEAPVANTGDNGRRVSDDGDEVTLAKEELNVGTQSREAGRARLRKYVTTEERTVTVPVKREEVRLDDRPDGALLAIVACKRGRRHAEARGEERDHVADALHRIGLPTPRMRGAQIQPIAA